jgi:hypothetical protein
MLQRYLKTSRLTAVTAVFQRAVVVNSRAVPVPWKVIKNGQRNGHGTRATGTVEPWPRARAAALVVEYKELENRTEKSWTEVRSRVRWTMEGGPIDPVIDTATAPLSSFRPRLEPNSTAPVAAVTPWATQLSCHSQLNRMVVLAVAFPSD